MSTRRPDSCATGGYDHGGAPTHAFNAVGEPEWSGGHPHAYGSQTPPDGVWMPQQRAAEGHYETELPPEQQYPHQGQSGGYQPNGYEHGYDEQQYRY